MVALFRKIISYKFFPVCWTVLLIVLLCIPGSLVPGKGLFSFEHLDKVVHLVLFGANVLFWGWHYAHSKASPSKLRGIYIMITLTTILLGVLMEFVQRDYIPNRSFDGYDII